MNGGGACCPVDYSFVDSLGVDSLPSFPNTLQAPSGYTLDGGWQVLQDGTLLASGQSMDGTKTPILADFNPDGSLNASFGVNGTITGNPGTDFQYAYQDSTTGEIVFNQFANQADGSTTEVDNFYTATGQAEPSHPSLISTIISCPGPVVDPMPIDPIVIDPIVPVDPVVIDPIPVDGGIGWWNSGDTGTVTLLNEDFSNGSWQAGTSWKNNGVTWNWQLVNGDVAPTEFEAYSAAGAPDRGMPATEGGFEVASSGNNGSLWAVTAFITLPDGLDASQSATISFDAGYRDQMTSGQFAIYDVTQGMDLLSPRQIDGSVGTWTGNQFSVDLSQTAPGDVIELRWLDSAGNSWSGLEVGSVNFTAASYDSTSPLDGLTAPDGVYLSGDYVFAGDGGLLASGYLSDETGAPVIIDYNADGSLNTDFGVNGILNGPAGVVDMWASVNDSGSIQVQGDIDNGDGTSSAFLAQYTSSGQLDTAFGGGTGYLVAPAGVSFDGNFQILADGSILASAVTTDGNFVPELVGYNADGTLNASFGTDGILFVPAGTTEFSVSETYSGVLQIQGNIDNRDGTGTAFFAQYSASGLLDTSFGGGSGFLIAPEGESFDGNFETLSDGSIVASVTSTDGSEISALAGYFADGTLNTSFGQGGLILGPDGTDALWVTDNWDGTFMVSADVVQGDSGSLQFDAIYSSSGELIGDFTPVAESAVSDSFDLADSNIAYNRFNSGGELSSETSSTGGSNETGTVSQDSSGSFDRQGLTAFYLPRFDSSFTPNETDHGSSSVSGSAEETDLTSLTHEPDTIVVSPAFDPSVLVSGIAGISALKLAASGSHREITDDNAQSNVDTTAFQEEPLTLPSKSGKSAKQTDETDGEISAEPAVDPSSAVTSEEELIAVLLAEA